MKVHINLSIDADVYNEIKIKNVNISGVVNDFLRKYFDVEKVSDDKSASEFDELYKKKLAEAETYKSLAKEKTKEYEKKRSGIKWL
jgi:hypothetical protein|tara:strand:- start:339 stop:596 length:258 start_codon:yes stop_codon:yes gene_type:complete